MSTMRTIGGISRVAAIAAIALTLLVSKPSRLAAKPPTTIIVTTAAELGAALSP